MVLALRGAALGSYKHDLPTWLVTLQCAEAWGMYPEDVAQRRGSLRWAARRGAYQEALRKVEELNRKMAEKK